jgi:ribose transport system ATP-binding protein
MVDSPSVVLRLRDVVKTFPGVVALKGVTFEVHAGEVHALVGENGAGKSTLMAVAAGSTVPDSGTVEIGGQPLEASSPTGAQALGLGIVYQHLSILEDLTVLENMVFAMPPPQRPSMSRAPAWTREHLASVGAEVDPADRVSDLSTANRQLVEIAKALALDAKVLILDEPTEALTRVESERLFENIRSIRDKGTAVVYISHRLPEVKRVADRITVLRDGETRGTFDATGISEGEILRLIIGRAVDQVFPDKRAEGEQASAALLEVDGLSGSGFSDVSVAVRPGEIVGLAGVEGNGQRSFLRALAGMHAARGAMSVAGSRLKLGHPTRMRSAGVIHLPGDRHREGVMLNLSVRENVSLLALRPASKGGFMRRARERPLVAAQIARLGIKTPSAETSVAALSGGNQQKVLFARALLGAPQVLLADEPTRGVDAGARIDLYQVMREAAAEGRAVLVLSSDAVELQGLCDRVLVFSRGRIVRELEGDEINEENITGAAVTSDRGHHGELQPQAVRKQRLLRFVSGDYLPSVVLAALVVLVAVLTSAHNGRFLSSFEVQNTLLLASVLAFVGLGQLVVLMTGNIDLSVGPLMGLIVVVVSYFWAVGQGTGDLLLGIVMVIATAIAVGLVIGLLRQVGRIPSVLASLAVYIVLQGIALQLRPVQAGQLRPDIVAGINTTIGWMPVSFIAAVVVTVVAEMLLRRTHAGLELRAVGSDESRAHRLGARINLTLILAFVLCSLFAAAAGILLAGQIGIGNGDQSVGSPYTLSSITAVVLGGASIFGGRGSFIGALLGALLLTEVVAAVPFLQAALSWNYWIPGIMVLVGAGIFSRARGRRTALLGSTGEA